MHTRLTHALTACCLLGASLAWAQSTNDSTVPPAAARKQASEIAAGDPARWHKADATDQERLRTMQKEIGAAYEEAKAACHTVAAAGRAACLQAARDTWQADLANARAQLDAAPASGVRPVRRQGRAGN